MPVLKDIPLLNLLFGTRTVRSNATELIVVVTARLTDAAPYVLPRQTGRRRAAGCAAITTEARRSLCLSLHLKRRMPGQNPPRPFDKLRATPPRRG